MGFWDAVAASGNVMKRFVQSSEPVSRLREQFAKQLHSVAPVLDYADTAVRAVLDPFRFLRGYLEGVVGSALSAAFGDVPNLVDYVREVFADGVLQHFYTLLFRDFNPDINGFTLAFLVPPAFSGLQGSFRDSTVNLVPFAAIDYAPPGTQLNTATLNPRTGAVPYATELSETNQFSISFIDDMDLDIFAFHCAWVYYIFELLNGTIAPSPEYIDGSLSGHLDYVGSLYVVKYMPDMQTITYVGKCTGVFPQALPVRELVGSRHTNELTTLPFTYMSAAYRDYVVGDVTSPNAYLFDELQTLALGRFFAPI